MSAMFSESSESLRPGPAPAARQFSTASSNKEEDVSISNDKRASSHGNQEEEDDVEPEEQDLEENTRFHVAQEHETFDHPTYQDKHDKPMMEITASTNVWYQATLLQSSWNEIKVLFPAVAEGEQEVREWVHKNSSRIWRGSLKSKDWKYLGKGAWEPRLGKQQGRTKAGRKAKRRRAASSQQQQHKHPRNGSAHDDTATGTGTGTSEGVTGQVHRAVEDDAASPRAVHIRKRSKQRSPSRAAQPAARGPAGAPAVEVSTSKGALERKFADSGGHGPSDAATSSDPLASWFHLHFTLLHRKGLLGRHSILDSPEAGCLPLPSIKPDSALPAILPAARAHSPSAESPDYLPQKGSAPQGGDAAAATARRLKGKRSEDNTSPQSRGSVPPKSGSGGKDKGLRELQGLYPWGWERNRPEGNSSDDENADTESDDEQPCPIRNRPQGKPTVPHKPHSAGKDAELHKHKGKHKDTAAAPHAS